MGSVTAQWVIELRGGSFDGWTGLTHQTPKRELTAWRCDVRTPTSCEGHAAFDARHPDVVRSTAVVYRLSATELSPHPMPQGQAPPRALYVPETERDVIERVFSRGDWSAT